MPNKRRIFDFVKFPPELVKEALEQYFKLSDNLIKKGKIERTVEINNNETWELDNDEEFFSEYRKEILGASYFSTKADDVKGDSLLAFRFSKNYTSISVKLNNRELIEKVLGIFEDSYDKYKIPPAQKEKEKEKSIQESVVIFIGHGRDDQWRDLKDHLHEKHHFKVEAYEIGARAGFTITDILKAMINSSSFALLVFTGENLDSQGKLHARENVIHETGLFQGKLGFRRAIVLLEDGCSEFSNIFGVHQIRFNKGNIKETYGDVLATIYREFGRFKE